MQKARTATNSSSLLIKLSVACLKAYSLREYDMYNCFKNFPFSDICDGRPLLAFIINIAINGETFCLTFLLLKVQTHTHTHRLDALQRQRVKQVHRAICSKSSSTLIRYDDKISIAPSIPFLLVMSTPKLQNFLLFFRLCPHLLG